jgi:hypothetical protein
VTFSALVDVLSQPAYRLPSILKAHKYPKPGPVFGYKKATAQIVDWLVKGTPLDVSEVGLRDHEIDALDALTELGTAAAILPGGATSASRPPASSSWIVNGVEVSFAPDVLLNGRIRKHDATGALKLYLRREPTTVGPMLAALLYYHRSQIVGDADADPALCAVTDVHSGVVHVATGSYQRLVNQIEATCTVIASTWPTV